jgi:hypothetical protein
MLLPERIRGAASDLPQQGRALPYLSLGKDEKEYWFPIPMH